MIDATPTHNYTTEDYKRYVFAEGRAYIVRIIDVLEALEKAHGIDPENYEDITAMLDQAITYLNRAAFTDHEDQQPRKVAEVSTFEDGRGCQRPRHFQEVECGHRAAWHPDPENLGHLVDAWPESSWGPVPFRWRHIKVTGPGTDVVHKVLDRDEIDRQIERYASLDAEGRRSIVGLQPKRADVILAGACIVRTVMEKLDQRALTVSDRGLRHGLLVDRFG